MTTSTGEPTPTPAGPTPTRVDLQQPLGRRGIAGLVVWALLLLLGFAVVFTLGQPLATSADQRADAYAPLPTPVTQEAAVAAADRIIALDYSGFVGATRSVTEGTSGNNKIWTVTYSLRNPTSSGVRVVVSESDGTIQVSTFP
jgi:type VI protein secretion system component VasK